MKRAAQNIIFYDGLCALCNGTVRFVLPRDRQGVFKFAALQGALAKKLLKGRELPDSIVLLNANGELLLKSEAILAVAAKLGAPWGFLAGWAGLVPWSLRDAIYDFVARHRKRILGRYDSCPLPRPEWKSRFLD